MMCSLDGISTMAPDTPQSAARRMSSRMQRQNAKISGPRLRFTISRIAPSSCFETAGMPASMRWTPASASASAMATFSSFFSAMPVSCSPSRKVMSWIFTLAGS